ncbi:CUB domain-containing protein 1 [Antennarius striatus]|uniref:CUB domain-containing protein 1 n=1 Tax=Antennarius striatus TaxID=241820 RepID=UPI0035B4749A
MRLRPTGALLAVLFLTLLDPTGSQHTVVRPDKGSTVTVSTTTTTSNQCSVCTVSGVNDTQTSCHASLSLVPEEEVKLLFQCPQPIAEAFTATIGRTIECTEDSCSPSTVETQPSVLADLSRTFTWELKAPAKTIVSLDILGEGLTESRQSCPGGLQFLVAVSKTSSKGRTRYCPGGSITRLDLPDQAVVTLEVKPGTEVKSVLFQASAGPLKGRIMVVTVDSDTTVVVSRDPEEPECNVCSTDGSTPNCSPTEKTLTNVDKLSLEFSCPKPQDVYTVNIHRKIECTKTSCTPAAGAVDPSLFQDFKRSLTWGIRVPDRTVLTVGFPAALKALSRSESCNDGPQYSVSTTNSEGKSKTSSYCKGGTLSSLDLLGATAVLIEAPKGEEVEPTAFTVKAAPRGGRMMSVTPDPDTIVMFTRVAEEPDCSVCENTEPKQTCNPRHLTLTTASNTSVEFTCPRPQDVFTVEVNKEIDCEKNPCPGDVLQAKSSLFPDFNRTFTWDLKVVSTRAFQLDFPEPGMRQVAKDEVCADGKTYSLVSYLRSGPANIGTFCKGGTVTSVLGRYKGRFVLQVPGDETLDPLDIKLSVGPETTMVAILKVSLPRGVSDTDFITANYPGDFPNNQQMQWDFTVPGMHNYTVLFQQHTAPECLSKEVEMEYLKNGMKVTQLSLTDPQPAHQQGSFSMVLKNCETNQTLPGLNLDYRVSVMRSGHPVLCSVDLTKLPGVSLQLENVGSDPYCEMSVGSEVQQKINVAVGSKASLSFLDCPNEDVRLTARKIIACQKMWSCSAVPLTVPKLDSCLRMPLHSFTWDLSVPKDGTLDLTSPTGSLKQSVPGQECSQSVLLHVAESDGFPIGDFCYNGVVKKVQVHANISVTATAQDFSRIRGPFLNVSFSEEIPETVIYRVTPKTSSPSLLATPNWPEGMRSFSTVSWIVSLPGQYQAQMEFVNISQPKCKDRHTSLKVRMLGQEEEILSRREDEEAEDKLVVPQSFYLNMSNCVPEEGQFGAVTRIDLQKKTNLLAIVLGIAGGLLLLLTVLAVVCIVLNKKKKIAKKNKEASIYMGKGNIFRPGDRHFSKSRSDNESHVYDSIDETMVYGHLLGDSSYSDSIQDRYNGMQPDSYQTFTGPTGEGKLPTIDEPDNEPEVERFNTFLGPSDGFMPPRPCTPINRQDSLGFQDSRMVDNELYTFKSTGDINTIRLSGVDLEPQPPIMEDYL